jgi:lipopolysaccharide transport system ATP-binding protein
MPQERIPSFKEYAIRWAKGQIRFQEFWALQGVSIAVQPGEVFGVIGPNGAGKSTLLKVVARVLRPTRGRVRIAGRVAPLLELGAGFDMELTGRENIFLNGAILGFNRTDIERRFDRIVDFAGLAEFIDAPLRSYSTGMVARLGFSVATDVRPEILIVDEILAVGDAEFQARSFERIQSFQAEGATILLVSHSLGRVEEMCSRALWLNHGQVVALGPAKAVVDRYLGRVSEAEAERLAQRIAAQGTGFSATPDAPAAPEIVADDGPSPDAARWGSRRIEFRELYLTDAAGTRQTIFATGQSLTLHLHYQAHEPIQDPIFGLAIYRQDGTHLTGPNTGFAGLDLGELSGAGEITYTIPALPLLEGLYHITLAIHNTTDTEMFDYLDKAVPFRIDNRGGTTKEHYGILTLSGTWEHHPIVEAA